VRESMAFYFDVIPSWDCFFLQSFSFLFEFCEIQRNREFVSTSLLRKIKSQRILSHPFEKSLQAFSLGPWTINSLGMSLISFHYFLSSLQIFWLFFLGLSSDLLISDFLFLAQLFFWQLLSFLINFLYHLKIIFLSPPTAPFLLLIKIWYFYSGKKLFCWTWNIHSWMWKLHSGWIKIQQFFFLSSLLDRS